ncbi:hypothetical protein NC652_016957 [Populus alba x Populus x berolinensis]|nr:hypothetical protein NC652_016957 [Populus alba x Populus x berolinensis]
MESRLVNSSTKVLLGDDRLQFTQYLFFLFYVRAALYVPIASFWLQVSEYVTLSW